MASAMISRFFMIADLAFLFPRDVHSANISGGAMREAQAQRRTLEIAARIARELIIGPLQQKAADEIHAGHDNG